MPSNPNESELQSSLNAALAGLGLPSPARNCVLQIQWFGVDLVARVRFQSLRQAKHLVNGGASPTAEFRFESAVSVPGARIKRWIEEVVAPDSLLLARRAMLKEGFKWPHGWPVLEPLIEMVEGSPVNIRAVPAW